MSDCEIRGRLSAYLDGELPADDRATIGRHVEHCAACAGELEELRRLAQQVRAGAPVAAAAVMKRLHARVEAMNERVVWRRTEYLAGALSAMAACLALVAAARLMTTEAPPPAAAAWEEATMLNDDTSGPGGREVALAEWMVSDLSEGGRGHE